MYWMRRRDEVMVADSRDRGGQAAHLAAIFSANNSCNCLSPKVSPPLPSVHPLMASPAAFAQNSGFSTTSVAGQRQVLQGNVAFCQACVPRVLALAERLSQVLASKTVKRCETLTG